MAKQDASVNIVTVHMAMGSDTEGRPAGYLGAHSDERAAKQASAASGQCLSPEGYSMPHEAIVTPSGEVYLLARAKPFHLDAS